MAIVTCWNGHSLFGPEITIMLSTAFDPMSQRLPYHLILGTPAGARLFQSPRRARLVAQIERILDQLHGRMLTAGSRGNDVHVLCLLPALDSVGHALRVLQRLLRDWIRETLQMRGFEWRGACGAIPISPVEVSRLCRTIGGPAADPARRPPPRARRISSRHAPA